MDPEFYRAGPSVKGKVEDNAKVRSGTQKDVNDLRSK
jgi:hypothetical protein